MSDEFIKAVLVEKIPRGKNLTKNTETQVKTELRKYWSKQEIEEKLNKCENLKKKMFCRFLWLSGLRITEAVNLTKKDIDWQNDTMTVKWLKSRKYKYRIVPMHPQLKLILEHYTAGVKQEENVFNFSRQYGYDIVKEIMGGNPHQFRHSFAIHCLQEGMELPKLSLLLGHKNVNTTMEYLKIVPSDQGKALLKVNF